MLTRQDRENRQKLLRVIGSCAAGHAFVACCVLAFILDERYDEVN